MSNVFYDKRLKKCKIASEHISTIGISPIKGLLKKLPFGRLRKCCKLTASAFRRTRAPWNAPSRHRFWSKFPPATESLSKWTPSFVDLDADWVAFVYVALISERSLYCFSRESVDLYCLFTFYCLSGRRLTKRVWFNCKREFHN